MKIPVEWNPSPSPALDLAMRRATDGFLEYFHRLHSEPEFQGTMAAAGVVIGGGVGMLLANEMTDEEIVEFVLKIAAGIRGELAQAVAIAQGFGQTKPCP